MSEGGIALLRHPQLLLTAAPIERNVAPAARHRETPAARRRRTSPPHAHPHDTSLSQGLQRVALVVLDLSGRLLLCVLGRVAVLPRTLRGVVEWVFKRAHRRGGT